MANTIENMRKKLSALTTDWKEDGSVPPNFIRETGMGDEVARVDRWCGGYQNVREPVVIGWRASNGNKSMSGVVLVSETCYDVALAITKAKGFASKALAELQER